VKTRNAILAAAALAALALGGTLWWLYTSLDSLAKSAIERYGPELTGASVSIGRVHIQATEGSATFTALQIGNLRGFSTPYAVRISELRARIDPATIASDVVHVREFVLLEPDIYYERGGENLNAIERNIDAYLARLAGPRKTGDAKRVKFVIDHLYVRNGRVHYGSGLSSALPELHLRDVGKKSNGATAGEVTREVWRAMLRSATSLASRAGSAIRGLFK